MVALIDKISEIVEAIDFVPKDEAKDLARDLLRYVSILDDYELAEEIEDIAWEHLKK